MELRDKKMFVMTEEERQAIRKVIDIFEGIFDTDTYNEFQLWQADPIKKNIVTSLSTIVGIYLFSREAEEGKYFCDLEELNRDLCEDACADDEEYYPEYDPDSSSYLYAEEDEPAAADEVLGYEE